MFPVRQAASDRLNSWKEIATYLGREQRTVQRWERTEGLPVHRLQHRKAGSVFALRAELDAWMERRSGQPSAPPSGRRRNWLRAGIAVLAMVLAVAGGWALLRRPAPPDAPNPINLTSDPGTELEARLAPDAAQVAYVWDGEGKDNFDIYIRTVAGSTPLRLTMDAASDYSPAWSPDGASIAFLRRTGPATASVFLVPALGRAERKIADLKTSEWAPWGCPGPHLDWSPDGKWLVTTGLAGDSPGDVLLRVSPSTGDVLPLTSLPPKLTGDMAPAFSPDGTAIAFSRMLSWGRSELYVLPVSRDVSPAGEVRKLETGSTWNASPAWSPDGRSLVFSTGSMDAPHLARIDAAASGQARRLAVSGDYGWMPSCVRSPRGHTRLVYTQHFQSVNIWRTDLGRGGARSLLIESAHWSYEPAWSPDGQRIAFLSDRTGYGEVWAADADGRNSQQWTFLRQPRLGGPRWSPDNRHIAFTAPGTRGSSIYLLDGPGSVPRLVRGSEECGYFEWAHDGQAIYFSFSSSRGPRAEIWKVPAAGGTAVQVTNDYGRVPAVSSDGRYLYYLKLTGPDGRNDLYRKSSDGAEEKVLEFVDAYSLADTGIAYKHYRPGPRPVGPYLELFRFSTGRSERLPDTPRPLRYGIALSRDGRYLLHAQADYHVSDLMLVEDFR